MKDSVLNKTISEILYNLEAYNNKIEFPKKPEGYRKEGYVYDEDQSVKWNREHRESLELEYQEGLSNYQRESSRLELQFKHDLIRASEKEYKINYQQGEIFYKEAWNEGHSEGLEEVVNQMIKLLEFYKEIKELE